MEILINRNGQNYGPFTPEQIKQGLKEGRLTLHDWACTRDNQTWRPLHEVLASLTSPKIPPSLPPSPKAPEPNQSTAPYQSPVPEVANPKLNNLIHSFLNEEQDPAVVTKVYDQLTQMCTPDETILYIAVQKRPVVTISPSSIALTTKRAIIFRPRMLGLAFNFEDFHWSHIANIHISETIMGSVFYITLMNNQKFSIDLLPKAQARRLYQFGQQMEEQMIRYRRELQMEEQRAGAANVNMSVNNSIQGNSPYETQPVNPATPYSALPQQAPLEDPVQKLQQLKRMLDGGLITPQEYDAKKAEIMARF